MHHTLKVVIALFLVMLTYSCQDNTIQPKPAAMLALQYPKSQYDKVQVADCPFEFEVNTYARVLSKTDCSMKLEYPHMNATVFIDYAPVKDNIRDLLIDGQKLSFAHNRMADVIDDKIYLNKDRKVYGMFYSIAGNAASNVQFYATDSVRNFLTASLYFDRAPNYDSIYPAVEYIKLDMRQIIETLEWKP